MDKVLEHVGIFLGKNNGKEEISDFSSKGITNKSKGLDYCLPRFSAASLPFFSCVLFSTAHLVFLRQSFACVTLSWKNFHDSPSLVSWSSHSSAWHWRLSRLSSTCLSSPISLSSARTLFSSLHTPKPFHRVWAPCLECACLNFAWNILSSSFCFYLHVIFS